MSEKIDKIRRAYRRGILNESTALKKIWQVLVSFGFSDFDIDMDYLHYVLYYGY